MMPDFNTGKTSRRSPAAGNLPEDWIHRSSVDSLDNLKRDRFELLSAYLDSEVTAEERRQVETWLASDPEVQQLYSRLLKLRYGMKGLPTPAQCPVEQTVQSVLNQLERKPRRNVAWGGMAIAALFVGAVTTIVLPPTSLHLQKLAESTRPAASPAFEAGQGLAIGLDRPVIDVAEMPATIPNSGVLNQLQTQPASPAGAP